MMLSCCDLGPFKSTTDVSKETLMKDYNGTQITEEFYGFFAPYWLFAMFEASISN